MKKKYSVSQKDKKDWINFAKKMDNISDKEDDSLQENQERNKIRRLDLNGHSLEDANKLVKKFIPVRKPSSRKGDNGKVLVLGGSYIYHGAPALASLAAL